MKLTKKLIEGIGWNYIGELYKKDTDRNQKIFELITEKYNCRLIFNKYSGKVETQIIEEESIKEIGKNMSQFMKYLHIKPCMYVEKNCSVDAIKWYTDGLLAKDEK